MYLVYGLRCASWVLATRCCLCGCACERAPAAACRLAALALGCYPLRVASRAAAATWPALGTAPALAPLRADPQGETPAPTILTGT
jgi:hypothetical protein